MMHPDVRPMRKTANRKAGRVIVALVAAVLVGLQLAGRAAEAKSPRFSAYPATETHRGAPKPPKLAGIALRPAYRDVIRQEAKRGPNFAGAYTVVTYGCGTGCQVVMVISARTGKVYTAPAAASYGVSFRRSSRLLVFNADPVNRLKARYYVFSRGKFRPVAKGGAIR